MGELREVQLIVRVSLDGIFGLFEDSKGYNSARIYAPTFAKQIPKELECRPQLASLS